MGGGAVSFKQVKFGEDFHPTNWSLGGAQFLFVTEEILYSITAVSDQGS